MMLREHYAAPAERVEIRHQIRSDVVGPESVEHDQEVTSGLMLHGDAELYRFCGLTVCPAVVALAGPAYQVRLNVDTT